MRPELHEIFSGSLMSPLGFKGIAWHLIITIATIPQMVIMLQLAWRSIGLIVRIKETIFPAIIMEILTCVSRGLFIVPIHVLIFGFSLFLITLVTRKVKIYQSIAAVLFTEFMIIGSSILFVEPFILLGGQYIKNLSLTNPIGFALGLILETLLPIVALYIIVRYKIVIFRFSTRRVANGN